MGTFFNTFTSSADGLVTPTPTRQPDPDTLTVNSDTNSSIDASLTIMEIT